ncbi:TRAP transporter small permease [Halomonas sp. Choline-3u-9]|uniref:TRAP transporter small permease n=1 Tax=Halomonas sp. Choline-3u-9 TaxID=2058313 RepID=UPI001E58BAD8|nr:TRAP transporter small permease [Halomonas sp. Choline-3u-9]
MSTFTKFKNAYFAFLEGIVVFLVIALAVVVTLGFVTRYLGSPLSWYDELAAALLAWVTYYGTALAAAKGAHITCPSVLNMCPPTIRVPLALLAEAITIGFFVFLGLASYQVMLILQDVGMVSLPEVSMQLVHSAIPVASVLFIIAELLRLPDVIKSTPG